MIILLLVLSTVFANTVFASQYVTEGGGYDENGNMLVLGTVSSISKGWVTVKYNTGNAVESVSMLTSNCSYMNSTPRVGDKVLVYALLFKATGEQFHIIHTLNVVPGDFRLDVSKGSFKDMMGEYWSNAKDRAFFSRFQKGICKSRNVEDFADTDVVSFFNYDMGGFTFEETRGRNGQLLELVNKKGGVTVVCAENGEGRPLLTSVNFPAELSKKLLALEAKSKQGVELTLKEGVAFIHFLLFNFESALDVALTTEEYCREALRAAYRIQEMITKRDTEAINKLFSVYVSSNNKLKGR